MLIVRPTATLARRMGLKLAAVHEKSTTSLGDWYAIDLVLSRKQYVLCVSEKARLPLLIPAAPYSKFPERIAPAARDLLRSIGVPEGKAAGELDQMNTIHLAKTDNRSVLGTINDFRQYLLIRDDRGEFCHEDLRAMSVDLSNFGSLVLDCFTPRETALKILGVPMGRHLTPVKS